MIFFKKKYFLSLVFMILLCFGTSVLFYSIYVDNSVQLPKMITTSEYEQFYKRHYQSYIISSNIDYPGKNGLGVKISKEQEKTAFDLHKFNIIASDSIPLDREVPERRNKKCLESLYPISLPSVSVIIIFHNEAFSTLMRTVYSVLNRSPDHLILEVILVDDGSDLNIHVDLGEKLEKEIEKHPKVKLARHTSHIGLVQARIDGSNLAKADILVFLDSHCEAHIGWLEPLVHSLVKDPKSAVVPIIDSINQYDFSIENHVINSFSVGTFDWGLDFDWQGTHFKDIDQPIDSPTMAGGLFAIRRDFFFSIGSYDPNYKQWGSENLEMSFRIWTCGGSIKTHPCSHFAHVFRAQSPHKLTSNLLMRNKARLMHVWLDEYKEIVMRRAKWLRTFDPGDISEQLKFRKDNNCKPFHWFVVNIMKPTYVPDFIPYASGQLKSKNSQLCIDNVNEKKDNNPVKLFACQESQNQYVEMSSKAEILQDDLCFDLNTHRPSTPVIWYKCHRQGGNQMWVHLKRGSLIKHLYHEVCLEEGDNVLISNVCDENNPKQIWSFEFYKNQ